MGWRQRERLHSHDRVGVELDDGLVVGHELSSLERVAQIALGLEALEGLGAHRLVEDLEAGLAVTLGLVHGGVGVAQDRVGGPEVRGQDHADARARNHLGGAEPHRLADRGAEARDYLLRGRAVRHVKAEDRELVAAEARHRVHRSGGPREPPSDGDQELVTGVATQRVVDQLEPIDVDQEHGQGPPVLLAGGERDRQVVHEHGAVGQPGERVVEGLAGGLLGDGLSAQARAALPLQAAFESRGILRPIHRRFAVHGHLAGPVTSRSSKASSRRSWLITSSRRSKKIRFMRPSRASPLQPPPHAARAPYIGHADRRLEHPRGGTTASGLRDRCSPARARPSSTPADAGRTPRRPRWPRTPAGAR